MYLNFFAALYGVPFLAILSLKFESLSLLDIQGDADYLRYRGLQEFDQAMQHLEEKYEVSVYIALAFSVLCFLISRTSSFHYFLRYFIEVLSNVISDLCAICLHTVENAWP